MQNGMQIGLGNRIEEIKNLVGSVQLLAKKTGISQSYLSRLMNGVVKNPTVEKIMRIAEAGNVSVDYLLTGKSSDERVAFPVSDIQGGASVYMDKCILDRVGKSADRCRVYFYQGDTMNHYRTGDLILVSIDEPSGDGIYLVDFGGGISVRRVSWIPGGMVSVTSDNYNENKIPVDDLVLMGKVVWAGVSQ